MTKVLFCAAPPAAIQDSPRMAPVRRPKKTAKDPLRVALDKLKSIKARYSSMPILDSVLVQSEKHRTVLSATNLVAWVRVVLPYPLGPEFSAAVPLLELEGIVKKLKGQVRLEPDPERDDCIKVSDGTVSMRLLVLPSEEFPVMPHDPAKPMWETSARVQPFIEGIKSVMPAMNDDETRLNLSQVLMEVRPRGTRFVTTDSHRLMTSFVKTCVSARAFSMNLNVEGVKPVTKFSDGEETMIVQAFPVESETAHSWIGFHGDNWNLLVREQEGRFPPYKQVYPKGKYGTKRRLKVDTDIFKTVLASVMEMAVDRSCSIRLEPAPTVLTLKASTADKGEAVATVPCEFSGPPLAKISYNGDYLMDLLRSCGPVLDLRLTDYIGPSVLYNGVKTHLLMPMRI